MDKTIKLKAKELFKQKQYAQSIDILHTLGAEKFLNYTLRKKRREKKDSWFKNTEFCKALVSKDDLFSQLFRLEKSEELMFDYFNHAVFLPEFELKLAREFPEVFIQAVRKSHSFLEDERLLLYMSLSLPTHLQKHPKFWKFAQKEEQQLWQAVEQHLLQICKNEHISLVDILTLATVWLENKRSATKGAEAISSFMNNTVLIEVYNLFISLLQHRFIKKSTDHTADIVDNFHKSHTQATQEKNETEVELLLNALHEWGKFKYRVLDNYCYNDSTNLIYESGNIYFRQTPQAAYLALLQINNILATKHYYTTIAQERHKKAVKNNNEFQANQYLSYFHTASLLKDLKLDTLNIQGEEIDIHDVMSSYILYIETAKNIYKQNSGNKNKKQAGYSLLHVETVQGILNKSALATRWPAFQYLNDQFSYELRPIKKFNRFNPNYQANITPFLKLNGGFLFSPSLCLQNNDLATNFANAALVNLNSHKSTYKRNKTATEMEEYLASLFRNKSWQVKLFSNEEVSQIQGDVDIAINDGNTSLLIQLKRTKIRTNIKEAYFEKIHVLKRAKKQLDDAEKFLTSNTEFFQLKENTHKWTVSNGLANTPQAEKNHLNVSYFTLISFLQHNKHIHSLKELIDACSPSMMLINWVKTYKDLGIDYHPEHFDYLIKYIHPADHDTLVHAEDSHSKYVQKYDSSFDFMARGETQKSVHVLESCIAERPDDYHARYALALVHLTSKNYAKAFYCYDKILEIIPNDPFIIREYINELKGVGNIEKATLLADKLASDYTFLDHYNS